MTPRAPALGALSLLVLVLALGLPERAAAQVAPLVLELTAGASVPVGSFAGGTRVGEGTSSGASFGAGFALSSSPRRSITLGFSQHRLRCRDAGCTGDSQYVATGVDVGLRLNLSTQGAVVPWVGASAVTTRVELDAIPGSPGGVSKLGFGGEAGAGLVLAAGSAVALIPSVRFTAVNTELPGGSLLRMRHLQLDVTLGVAF